MRVRQVWTTCLICLGCQSITSVPPQMAAPAVVGRARGASQGQGSPLASATGSPSAPNDLTLAAACIEKGDDAAACRHLGQFLETHPEHRNARFYHAELLLKLGRH